MLRQMTTEQG